MITKITTANANKYRVLFDKATRALRSYDEQGVPVGAPGAGSPVLDPANARYVKVELTADTFLAGQHFYGDGEPVEGVYPRYIQTSLGDMFDSNKEYFVQEAEINSLEQYFSYIEYLRKINPIYTILPVDENIFEIDANARTISVPAEFQANGVSVQDDEISEVLYFRIDRFFDMEDLALDDIFIEWRCPANDEGEVIEGVSKPWARDLESDPGHIIFGWPLASEITATPGDVTFAVRFYRFGEGAGYENQVVYSFSTLTNRVTIKPGINLRQSLVQNSLDPNASPASNPLIEARIMNSEADIYGVPPVSPVIELCEVNISDNAALREHMFNGDDSTFGVRYLPLVEATADDRKQSKYEEYYVYTTDPRTGLAEGGLGYDGFYRVMATTTDLGRLSTAWIKMDTDNNIANLDQLSGDTNYAAYVDVTDHEFKPNYVYYKPDHSLYEGELEGDPTAIPVDPLDPEGETYCLQIMCAQVVIRSENEFGNSNTTDDDKLVLGTYQPRVSNSLNRKTARVYGPIVRVEGPIAPVMITDVPDRAIITAESASTPLSVAAEVDAHGYTTFEWYKLNTTSNEFELLDNEIKEVDWNSRTPNKKDGLDQTLTCDVTSQVFNVTEDGYYKVNINTLSNTANQRFEDDVNIVRVTHSAGQVVLNAEDLTALASRYILISEEMPLTFTHNETEGSQRVITDPLTDGDYYHYQWYRFVATEAEGHDPESAAVAAAAGTYIPSEADIALTGPNMSGDLSGAVDNNAITTTIPNTADNESGNYFCIITNHYNGETATTSTPFFYNNDIE